MPFFLGGEGGGGFGEGYVNTEILLITDFLESLFESILGISLSLSLFISCR